MSSGGTRGISYAGALAELEELGHIDFATLEEVRGTSIGACVGLLVATGMDSAALLREAASITMDRFLDVSVLHLAYRWGLDSTSKIRSFFGGVLASKGIKADVTFAEFAAATGRRLVVVACDLQTNTPVYFGPSTTPHARVVDGVVASMALPLLFTPVRWRGRILVDGALQDSFPITGCDPATTIGIRLAWDKAGPIDRIDKYISRVVFCALSHAEPDSSAFDVIDVDVGDTTTVSFQMPPDVAHGMIVAGRRAVRRWAIGKHLRGRPPSVDTPTSSAQATGGTCGGGGTARGGAAQSRGAAAPTSAAGGPALAAARTGPPAPPAPPAGSGT